MQRAIATTNLPAHVRVLTDGGEALAALHAADEQGEPCPDLLILDINMPRQSGMAVLDYLKATQRCRNTVVIVATTSQSETDRQRVLALGATAYFSKPSGYEEFMKLGDLLKTLFSGNQNAV